MEINYKWDYDSEGNNVLILTKKRGKFKISEIEEFLKYEMKATVDFYLNFSCSEETFEPSGLIDLDEKGDTVILVEGI